MEELRTGPLAQVQCSSSGNAGPVYKCSSLRTPPLLCCLVALTMLLLSASFADGRSIDNLLSREAEAAAAAARGGERDGFNAAAHKGVVQSQDVAASSSSSSTSLASYPYLGLEEFLPTSTTRRSLAGPGSSPPQCIWKCGRCVPCKPVHVPIQPGLVKTAEYYPEAWRCKCGNKLFMP